MADEVHVLEQLRGRLAHLEARQRATGSTAEPGFWDSVVATAAGDAGPTGTPGAKGRSAGSARGGARTGLGRQRRLAPHARRQTGASGPWSEVSPTTLEAIDPSQLDLASGSDPEDPGWVEAVAARAESHQAEDGEAGSGAAGSHEAEDGAAEVHEAGRGEGVHPTGAVEPVPVMVEALLGMSLHRHHEAELSAAAEWIARQRASHDVMLVNVIAELEARGTAPPDGLSRTDWLRAQDPSLSAGLARGFVRVGAAVSRPEWHRLRMLVTTGQVSVPKAAQIVEFAERTAPVADADDLQVALADLLSQAPALRGEELSTLIRHHAEQVRPPIDQDALDEGRRRARGVWFAQPNATGMVTMRATLDPEAAAVLKSAVDPLSLPCPTRDQHGHLTELDTRTPARRRADALLELVARGVSAPDAVATTDKAKVVVLIDHETLLGQVRGTGQTLSGEVLSAQVVRRIACDASIIPVVLGAQGEPLDVGRERRLVTRGLRLALIARDRGCSFPGCTIPPQWTDAHHVVHWSRGGRTSLLSTALLCRRHHTHVHRHDLTASVTAAGVTWHV